MLKVMDGVDDPLIVHAHVMIDLPQEHGHQPCLPVMAVNDVWPLARFQLEFNGGPAEEGEAHDVVVRTVKRPPLKRLSLEWGSMK